jgi:hypothetical protein
MPPQDPPGEAFGDRVEIGDPTGQVGRDDGVSDRVEDGLGVFLPTDLSRFRRSQPMLEVDW